MVEINWSRVAAEVRRVAQRRLDEAKAGYPYLGITGGPKAGIRRALGYTDRRTFDLRWDGEVPYTLDQIVTIADLLGVREADLLIAHHEDDDPRDDA